MRKHLIKSAGYYYNDAVFPRDNQTRYTKDEKIVLISNAYNHVENALAAALSCLKECSDQKAKDFLDNYQKQGNIIPQ